MSANLSVCQKLCVAGLLVLFLLTAVGTAIDSNSSYSHSLYQGKPDIDVAAAHIFYGLNFALMAVGLSVLGLVVIALLLGLSILSVFLGFLSIDRAIKPMENSL